MGDDRITKSNADLMRTPSLCEDPAIIEAHAKLEEAARRTQRRSGALAKLLGEDGARRAKK